MSSKQNEKKSEQLGVNYGTASHRLRKKILFDLMVRCDLDTCFQCKEKIENMDEMSIEHKVPWLDSEDPTGLFYDLENIAFSHLSCNISAARKVNKIYDSAVERNRASAKRYDRKQENKEKRKIRRLKRRELTGKW